MIPQTHRQETLHRAFVSAIAAYAGIKTEWKEGVEYGIDGSFRLVTELLFRNGKTRLSETGFALDFQLKSTVGCRYLQNETEVAYDCEADAYNKMVLQNAAGTVPVLLLVLCLPPQEGEWLSVTEESLQLRRACYWFHVVGGETRNADGHTIRIPRSQLFTAGTLNRLMNRIQSQGGEL